MAVRRRVRRGSSVGGRGTVTRAAVLALVLAACVGAVAGCSIAGSWKRIAVDPPGVPFPVDYVTFDHNDNYTATWTYEGKTRTSTGRYHWNGFSLEVLQTGSQPRKYRARRQLDGKLVLTYEEGAAKATATLQRVGPAPAEQH